MSRAASAPAPCPPWLRLELVPDLSALARLEAKILGGEAGEAALVASYRAQRRAYRLSLAYPHLAACSTGEHRLPAVDYTFFAHDFAPKELLLSATELHDLRLHDSRLRPEVQAYLEALAPLSPSEEANAPWLRRIVEAQGTPARGELVLDVFAAFGKAHGKLLTWCAMPVQEASLDLQGNPCLGWRLPTRAALFHHRACQIIARDPSVAAGVMLALETLFWRDGGLLGVTFAELSAVFAELGPLEARSATLSPD